ncbi:hypothetical protein EVJ50_05520 [Synechococcus sp. RSCCF101]|uniref:sulfotransferase domain-containing protein n=1 Tax=Synechococcus sp. RSCCF101 TaxID=2511069 RepID=UPI001245AE22|nr:sulfotransferase domain-containing protein [Synechococcus sp. RSCCF101]QEY31789.1 hypothetical protein EVJ50_05520 [Synechococcus sp. RSCCF101]
MALSSTAGRCLQQLQQRPGDRGALAHLYYLPLAAAEKRLALDALAELAGLGRLEQSLSAAQRQRALSSPAITPMLLALLALWASELEQEGLDAALRRCLWERTVPAERLLPEAPATAEPASAGPGLLIIGAPKSGTTSLAAYLARHREVWMHPIKELHFFDQRWPLGASWYRQRFPRFEEGLGMLCAEATPSYLLDGAVPARVQRTLGRVKLIALLREPLERAHSWLRHMRQFTPLPRSDAALLREEAEALAGGSGAAHPPVRALEGSLYGRHLQAWRRCFGEDTLLLLRFEDLRDQPEAVMDRVVHFLQLPADAAEPPRFPVYNPSSTPAEPLPIDLARELRAGVLAEALDLWASL